MPEAGHVFREPRSVSFKAQENGLAVNAYGERFNDAFDDVKRDKQIRKSGTELYRKAENVKLLTGAEEEYKNIHSKAVKDLCKKKGFPGFTGQEEAFKSISTLMRIKDADHNLEIWQDYTGDHAARFQAIDSLLSDFVEQDYDFDLSTDETFAKESLRFIQISKKAEAVIELIKLNIDYWSAAGDDVKSAVMKKIHQADLLWDYYKKREALILDPIYSTRMDSELSYINIDGANLVRTQQNMTTVNRMTEAERAYERLKHMEDEDREEQVAAAMEQKTVDQENVFAKKIAVPIGKKVKGTARAFEWLDMFGLPLKITSFFMRNKRTKDHGRKKYREMSDKFEKQYPKELQQIGRGKHAFIRQFNGKDGGAPAIDLNPLFTDRLKLEIRLTVEANEGLLLPESDAPVEIETMGLYEEFVQAAEKYTSIGGIVNADTTEMEMAFLDRMQEIREEVKKSFPSPEGLPDSAKRRILIIDEIMQRVKDLRSGNLARTADREDYESAVRQSQAIIQDTTITKNLDESNIKDIPLFTHQPNINDIKQGTIGDCYLVAAMTSFVKASPKGVLNMFQDLGDGNVMVRLFEGYDERGKRISNPSDWTTKQNVTMRPMYVKLRKHYETGDGNANDCVWPQLIEKAYAACGFNMKGEAYVDEKGYLHNMEKELTVGMGMVALAHLTGTRKQKTGVNAAVTNDENKQLKKEFGEAMGSPEFIHEVCAGIPCFIVDRMTETMSDNVFRTMDIETLEYNLNRTLEMVASEYGTMLLQIKKNYLRSGLGSDEYGPVIQKIAEYLDLPLDSDWDKTKEFKARMWNGEDQIIKFDLDTNDQRWDAMFTPGYGSRYLDKLRENFDNIINGRPVTYHPRGLDSDSFSDDVVRQFLIDLASRGKKDMVPGIKEEEQPKVQREDSVKMLEEVKAILGLNDNEVFRKNVVDTHASAYRDFWGDEKKASKMRKFASRMILPVHHNIRENMMDFMVTLKDTLNKGGSLEISINHFVSAVGMEYHDKDWYVLIKDPFNVYNMSYEKGGEKDKLHEESFLDVLDTDVYEQKRHLNEKGDEKETLRGAYRGLSYWKLEDLYAKMKDYTVVLPEDVRAN